MMNRNGGNRGIGNRKSFPSASVVPLKRFFAQAKLPLTSAQEKALSGIIDLEGKALQAAGQNEDAVRRVNAEYNKKLNELLTADQRAEFHFPRNSWNL